MSLVAYGSSDESEEEIATSQPSTTHITSKITESASKKRREAVKISIPSLKEFEDEESPIIPKKPKLQSGSGLFSLLPPPKNTSTLSKPGFVPYVLSKKETSLNPPKCEKNKPVKTEASDDACSSTFEEYDDEISNSVEKSDKSSNCSAKRDFFSLDNLSSANKLNDRSNFSSLHSETGSLFDPAEKDRLSQNESSLQLPCASSSDSQQSYLSQTSEDIHYSQEQEVDKHLYMYENHYTEPVANVDSEESLLNDKEFLKLQGRRREFQNIEIKEIKAEDQVIDKNEWLMKSITEESAHRPSRKSHNMPTQQQKRKHQITYLAFQAKEREMDLKNQWAMNSRTRRETQAKYGF